MIPVPSSPPRCSLDRLVIDVAAVLARRAEEVELEQAVRGLDADDERTLQGRLREGLAKLGYGAAIEQRYPADRHLRPRHGRRCDLVLTADGSPLDDEAPQRSLFGPRITTPADEALWIELKVVAQFVEGRANRAYESLLRRPVLADVAKLARCSGIRQAAVILILFTADDLTAEHDLQAWAQLGRRLGLPLGALRRRSFPVGDRFGNRRCTAALFPVER